MKLRSLLATAFLLAISALPAAAQVRLTGRVLDDDSGNPVAGARVEIYDFGGYKLAQVSTDSSGSFAYPLRRPGTYRLRVSRVGFRGTDTPELSTGANSYVNVEVRLKSDAVLLTPLTVVARTPAYRSPVLDGFHARLGSGLGTFFTRADVERIKPSYLSDMVTRVPGMTVASAGSGTERHIYVGRNMGLRSCPAQIWVDGFLLNPRSPDGEIVGMTLDEAVSPSNVEGIEIYRGLSTVPAEFLNQDARCGVIAVWTRRGGHR
jgi:5-hydroxyisourate hydrolase-like protein (transthyretin family)